MTYTDETLHLISRYRSRRRARRHPLRLRGRRARPRGRDRQRAPAVEPLRARARARRQDARRGARERARDAARRDPPLPRVARAAGPPRHPDLPHRRLQLALAPRLDARRRGGAAAGQVPAALARLGGGRARGLPRLVPRDPPGPGRAPRSDLDGGHAAAPHQGPRDARPDRLGHRERARHHAREPARRRAGRPGRGHRRAVGLRPPRGGLDLRRHRRGGAAAGARGAARGAPRRSGDDPLHRRARTREADRHPAGREAQADRVAPDRRHLGSPRRLLRHRRAAARRATGRRCSPTAA